ncbi:hypothetical protein QAD02_002272 [Eretmocerus hayati]|uniref:Uncharacterized protein n=1 Tax=Eretmocerus hayati TaxID=131215 RepID=A0ACC2NJM1_9HYME|nr:hypothetical protein QAD02_002272 [Eretmocerus hayati]
MGSKLCDESKKLTDKPLVKKQRNQNSFAEAIPQEFKKPHETSSTFNTTPVIPLEKFEEFLDKSTGCSDIHLLLSEYMQDQDGVIKMIDTAYAEAEDRSRKTRLMKVKNRLNKTRSKSSDSRSSTRSLVSP